MTREEIITRAQAYAVESAKRPVVGSPKYRPAAVVDFQTELDHIRVEIIIDTETGEFIQCTFTGDQAKRTKAT